MLHAADNKYELVRKGNHTFESFVQGKSWGREILCILGVPNLIPQHYTSSYQLCIYNFFFFFTVLGDLKGDPAVHFDVPLQSFSLYITFKSRIAAVGEPNPLEL